MEKIIVVFDGFCILCNNYIGWLSKNNPDKNIYFTNFESTYIKKEYPNLKLTNTVLVINEKNDILTKSNAIKYCINHIRINIIIKSIINITPNFIINVFYDLIAKNRYILFGKNDSCQVPKNINDKNILF
jgi:predicted DCC family thiol-disulfide oxidoreductase YuxK